MGDATVVGHVVTAGRVVSHPDRNVALLRLNKPITDVAPIPVASTATQIGEELRVAGYGRTGTEWISGGLQSAMFTVNAVGGTGFDVLGTGTSAASLCRGDAGAPAFRDNASGVALVGVASTSWQAGCLGETATTQGGTQTRVDGLTDWITQTTTAGVFVPVQGRVMDTRTGTGGYSTPMVANVVRAIPIAGVAGVPTTGVNAVAVSVTAVVATGAGTVSLGASDAGTPSGTALIYNSGDSVSNTALVAVGADGKVNVVSNNAVDLVVDLQGYFTTSTTTAGSGFVALPGTRIVDTRSGLGATKAKISNGGSVTVDVLAGGAGVPNTATALFANITVTGQAGTGYLHAYPAGSASNGPSLNFDTDTTALGTMIRLNTAGKFTLTVNSGGPLNVIVDVEGYFDGSNTATLFTPINTRVFDSRISPHVALAANSVTTIKVADIDGIPAITNGVSTVVLNLQTVNTTTSTGGNLRVWPTGQSEPATSNLNYTTGTLFRSSLVIVAPGADNSVLIRNNSTGPVHLVIDAEGWCASAPTEPAPSTEPTTPELGGSLVEDYSYPGAAAIEAAQNITLVSGDGHILLADCASEPVANIGVIKVATNAQPAPDGTGLVCFKVTATTGLLNLRVPGVYEIRGDGQKTGTGHTITALVTTDAGVQTSVAVNPSGSTQVGIGVDDDAAPTTLLQLKVTA